MAKAVKEDPKKKEEPRKPSKALVDQKGGALTSRPS